jgi:hypothetical protein
MLLTLPNVPLRSASFALEDRWLIWARVRMYPDRLVLTAWSLTGRDHRQIPLDQVEETDHEDRCLRIALTDGEQVSLIVDEAARWARFIQAHCELQDHHRFG